MNCFFFKGFSGVRRDLIGMCVSFLYRRHLPPPRTNFEKLQDILLKRKGMKLDTSSSGALAASLDQCVVRRLLSCLSLQVHFSSIFFF